MPRPTYWNLLSHTRDNHLCSNRHTNNETSRQSAIQDLSQAGILEGFSLYISDIRELTRNHLARVLKSGNSSEGSRIPKVTLRAYVPPASVQFTQDTATLEFSFSSTSHSIAHVFKRVPQSHICNFLRTVAAAEFDHTHSLNPRPLTWLVNWVRKAASGPFISERVFRRADPAAIVIPISSSADGADSLTADHAAVPWLQTCQEATTLYRQIVAAFSEDRADDFEEPISVSLPNTWGVIRPAGIFLDTALDETVHPTPIIILIEPENSDDREEDDDNRACQLLIISGNPIVVQEIFIQYAGSAFKPFWRQRCGRQLLEHQDVYGIGDNGDRECLICLTAPKDAILLPCRHCSSCASCLQALFQDKCPICRTPFVGWVQIPWLEMRSR
eukprot:Blabericola_migrator_1__4516@NODE_2406_length_2814_cov_120_210047_g453_i4_p1_GENE_NODE_2406_length_2814_cov_120_210047_g453_i4NODE_2406_length_2814_cov_120_210047_g453_i4_p1_ORF_typecomplete_len387_score34_61zfC3HC4_3/PF13920_6/1_5e12ProkRING_4/PF14447_6/4_3e08zfRING_5/PF14634_6/0_00011zfC3HC4/PF00097_25/0_007zfRING_6/PF14835_6/0_0068zfRING_2/PF13639_6/0_01zfC3HC4_2/PF13923_6/0_027TcdB_N/PF12918_7/7_9e03TcdB_N/PF12918_7/0_63zfRING_UBOX/PF13445_6/2_6zfRING_UBOX/PF13445_6/56zfC3HC4_4/PF15227_6/1_9